MLKENPWTKLDSKVIYRNPWLTLREDSVLRPDGERGIYSVFETRIATGVVALTPTGEIYLVGQFRYATDVYSWEIVEGGSEPCEEPLIAAQRDLMEEAGLIAETWTPLGGEIHLSNCISSEAGFLYLAEGLTETEKAPDATEILEVKTVPFRDAVRMVESGEIQDAMSIMGILRTERLLRERI